MQEIVRINLDNEMDLILAHKRSMKIAELCGLPSSAQTRFSTAVSEVARCCIANGKESILTLGIHVISMTRKEIRAVLTDLVDIKKCSPEAYAYAARISGNIEYQLSEKMFITTLSQPVASPGLLTDTKIKGFKDYFKYEPPLSPYDEIRKKNIELIALSEKLRESENRYKQLTKTLPVLICTVDERNKILLTNNWLRTYLDTPLVQFNKEAMSQFLAPDDVDGIARGWEVAKLSGSAFHGQARIITRGLEVWHLVSILPNKAEDGSFTSWLIFFVDINAQKIVEETLKDNTELKRMQQELENSNSQLSFKNKELEQFAFIASHDLQEPLRKIMMMLSRADEHLSEGQRQRLYIDKIREAAERMSTLITDVLRYSRIGHVNTGFEAVDLNVVVSEALKDLSFIVEEKAAIVSAVHLPTIMGLETQLRQLFYNIISNALKFNENTPEVAIKCTSVNPGQYPEHLLLKGSQYKIAIADNGIGIENSYADKIFHMFQRLHHRDTFGGNGIGLALCRRIVENHSGALTFDSIPGKGTEFYIYFPLGTP